MQLSFMALLQLVLSPAVAAASGTLWLHEKQRFEGVFGTYGVLAALSGGAFWLMLSWSPPPAVGEVVAPRADQWPTPRASPRSPRRRSRE